MSEFLYQEENSDTNNKASYDISKKNVWSENKHDIGLRILKEKRDRITYAGKYSERYKDLKLIRSSSMYQNYRQETPTSDNDNTTCPSFIQNQFNNMKHERTNGNESVVESPTRPRKLQNLVQSSNPTSPKFNHKESPIFVRKQPMSPNFKAIKKYIKDKETGSNATYDLNNSTNVSQLTSYKIKKSDDLKIPIDYTEVNYLTVPNNAALCSTPTNPEDNSFETMRLLKNVESFIAKREENENLRNNFHKFDELIKKQSAATALLQEDIKIKKEKSQDFEKAIPLADPLKSYGEVENLLRPGVSNLEPDQIVELRRSDKEERMPEKKKNYPVARTVSDVQDNRRVRHVLEKQLPKPRVRPKVF